MAAAVYPWTRFWSKRGTTISLADGGFLVDPDTSWGTAYNPNVFRLDGVSELSCLILLGEPGMGKTHAMESEYLNAMQSANETGDLATLVDLREYGSEDRLVRDLFGSETVRAWTHGSNFLYLYLDSVDECLLRIETLSALLLSQLKRLPVERLRLRLACRTADWPASLEAGLMKLWSDSDVCAVELAPLRRKDIEVAAAAYQLGAGAFLAAVSKADATPLAIKPVTLQFLLNTYRNRGQLPSDPVQLYTAGCGLLCEETNVERRETHRTGTLSADQRMAVAGRIAAVTVLGNRYAVWVGVDKGDVPPEDVTVHTIVGHTETVAGQVFTVGQDEIRETLDTGLFSSRGLHRLGWAHQTYAEFLTAWYLAERDMSTAQIMSLLCHHEDPDGKLIPQLHQAAAWLATLRPEVWKRIFVSDPEVLLQSDTTVDANKAALVDSLLALYERGQALDISRTTYRRLSYRGLGQQLLPFITDKTKDYVVRRAAIDMAEETGADGIMSHLVNIALDHDEEYRVRVQAAHAVSVAGSEQDHLKLKPLLLEDNDFDDELKGHALEATWPKLLSADDLFRSLTTPIRKHFYGSYRYFLRGGNIVTYLRATDFPTALRWVATQAPSSTLPGTEELVRDIIVAAWNYWNPDLLEPLAQAVLARIKQHDNLPVDFVEGLRRSSSRRQDLILSLLKMSTTTNDDVLYVLHSGLVTVEDLQWLLAQIRQFTPDLQEAVFFLLQYFLTDDNKELVEGVYELRHVFPNLLDRFPWAYKPVDLESARADQMRRQYRQRLELERPYEPPIITPSPEERVRYLLDRFECQADFDSFWRLNREMTRDQGATYYNDLEFDLTQTPVWKKADELLRDRIVAAAEIYIRLGEPNTESWLGTSTLHHPATAGYRSLLLLMGQAPDKFAKITCDCWRKWAPIVLACPISTGTSDDAPHRKLVNCCYVHAQDEILKTLSVLIDQESQVHEHIFVIRKMAELWDGKIASVLMTKARGTHLKPSCMGNLLDVLIDHQNQEAIQFAATLVNSCLDQARSVEAAKSLALDTTGSAWSIVWNVMTTTPDLGRSIVLRLADEVEYRGAFLNQLTEEELADLYLWLVENFPPAEDPKEEDAHWVSPRENAGHFRDAVIERLKYRGSFAACEQLERIVKVLPAHKWLKYLALEARAHTRRVTWTPAPPEAIIQLTRNRDVRFVASGEQLVSVLCESLDRLEQSLQGETPAAVDLWNQDPKGAYRPKDENDLSNKVKRHLADDLVTRGVIANREVEIRRGYGGALGERTDIQVDAIVCGQGSALDVITVIIEVKGCWNDKLNAAMETQLRDRYLADNECQYGIYLVGWFACPQWDDSDPRKRQTAVGTIQDAREKFSRQAAGLSRPDANITAYVLNAALR